MEGYAEIVGRLGLAELMAFDTLTRTTATEFFSFEARMIEVSKCMGQLLFIVCRFFSEVKVSALGFGPFSWW